MPRKRLLRMTVALVAAVFVCVLVASWRDPMWLVHGEFARQRWMAGLSQHETRVAGHRWVYAQRDAADPRAPTLVMIHGFTGSKENWYPLAGRLRDRYRLVIPDLPGWGASERRAGEDYGYLAQSRRVAAFVDALRMKDSPVVLIGHSMGGGIVALAAADHPESIARVGLIDAAGVRFSDNAFGRAVLDGRNPFAVQDAASLQRYFDTVFHRAQSKPWLPWPASRAFIDWRTRQAPFEQAVLERIGRSTERFLPGERAAGITQPTLLLWCDEDRVIDPSALDLYAARIPQAHRVRLPDCGHMSIMERPGDVAAAVEQLIRNGVPR